MAFFNYRRFNDCMAEDESPPVYVVDTHASRPPLPPRSNHKPKHSSRTQILLFLLVSLAFFGLFIEACIIFFLHQADVPASPVAHMQTGDKDLAPRDHPSKPVAHMTGVQFHDSHIMAWDMKPEPILYGMRCDNISLIIEKTGYYYVYSKVHFSESKAFYHHVQKRTQKYGNKPIPLLKSRKYSSSSDTATSNSFLGGVFYLEVKDVVFVSVSDTKQIRFQNAEENVFGIYMI